MTDFEFPLPTTLSDENVERVIVGLSTLAGSFEGSAATLGAAGDDAGHADDFLAAFQTAAEEFVREYLERRRAGDPDCQRIVL